MAKIDVDQNQRLTQALAQQGLPLQSIPTVVAFVQGRPVDMFQGAVPASEIDAFIASHRPIPNHMKVSEAPFWSEAQGSFLKEQLMDDAEWAPVVDELNVRLHEQGDE